MKNKLIKLQKSGYKAIALAAASTASVSAFATTDEDVTAAFTAGETTYQLATSGLIGLAAIGVAVGLVIAMFRKS